MFNRNSGNKKIYYCFPCFTGNIFAFDCKKEKPPSDESGLPFKYCGSNLIFQSRHPEAQPKS